MNRLSLPIRLLLLVALALAPGLALALALVRDGVGDVTPWVGSVLAGLLYLAALAVCWLVIRNWCGEVSAAAAANATALRGSERELQANLAQRDLVLRELHHRVKNNLQMISSLLSLQADRIRSPRIRLIFADAQNRVVSLSLLHRHLYARSNWTQVDFQAFLNDLVRHLSTTRERLGGATVPVEIDAPVAPVGPDIAIPLGLIVTEAVSNALRHAFAGVPAPQITIRVRNGAGRFELTIDDDGVGIAPEAIPPADGDGLGFTLVRGLAAQLGGEATVSRRAEGGTRVLVAFASPAVEGGDRMSVQAGGTSGA